MQKLIIFWSLIVHSIHLFCGTSGYIDIIHMALGSDLSILLSGLHFLWSSNLLISHIIFLCQRTISTWGKHSVRPEQSPDIHIAHMTAPSMPSLKQSQRAVVLSRCSWEEDHIQEVLVVRIICLSPPPAGVRLFFSWRKRTNHFCINYWVLNDITEKNCCLLLLSISREPRSF